MENLRYFKKLFLANLTKINDRPILRKMLIWVTGLAGAGKTTIATALYYQLKLTYAHLVLLDGDAFREIMGQGAGYDTVGRLTVARRIARLCKYLTEQGIDVICATISMYEEIHAFNRKNIKDYYEILVDVSMDNLIRYDKNSLYSKALNKEIQHVIGIDMPFERPEHPHLVIDNNERQDLAVKVQYIINLIKKRK